jgi:amidophosphoribosyltransferase
VIQTAFNVSIDKIKEIKPGHALIIMKDGDVRQMEINKSTKVTQCYFERAY